VTHRVVQKRWQHYDYHSGLTAKAVAALSATPQMGTQVLKLRNREASSSWHSSHCSWPFFERAYFSLSPLISWWRFDCPSDAICIQLLKDSTQSRKPTCFYSPSRST